MRAWRLHQFGDPSLLRLETITTPAPQADSVLVDVHAIGLNFPDLLLIGGQYQRLPALPFTPGTDFAGTVRAVGEAVADIRVGQRVLGHVDHGAFAEQLVVWPRQLWKLPGGMDFATAAAMGLAYQTAYFALVERARCRKGESVLIGGATGGVGLAAIQIAKAFGLRVIAAVRCEDDLGKMRGNGADAVVRIDGDDLRENLRRQVLDANEGHGADIVLDMLGAEFSTAALRAMAWCGRLVVVGFAAGGIPSIKLNYLLLKNIEVSGLQWTDYRDRAPQRVARAQDELFRMWSEGGVHPPLVARHSFDALPQALLRQIQGSVGGKQVVDVR